MKKVPADVSQSRQDSKVGRLSKLKSQKYVFDKSLWLDLFGLPRCTLMLLQGAGARPCHGPHGETYADSKMNVIEKQQ